MRTLRMGPRGWYQNRPRASGRIAPGRWAVAIRLLKDAWLYDVNVDALGAPAPK
jgi:hypothetical protein